MYVLCLCLEDIYPPTSKGIHTFPLQTRSNNMVKPEAPIIVYYDFIVS